MKIFKNKMIVLVLSIFFMPVLIKSHSLKLTYQINKMKKEIKKIEMENQYLKKQFYHISSLSQIRKKAYDLGFKTPQPYTIVMLNSNSEKNENKSMNIFAKIAKNIIKTNNS